jgi:spermidine/putrescine transport system permease protein
MITSRLPRTILAAPGLTWIALFLLVPCGVLFFNAFFERGVYGGIDYDAPTLDNFRRTVEPLYLEVFLNSARIAGIATAIAVLIGYPAAFAISLAPPRRHTALLFLVMLPFWTNYLIRTYAWMVLLNRAGLVNAGLLGGGIISEPLDLLYGEFAVVLGLVYAYLPFVILAIYTSISRLDGALLEASADLGASGARTFFRVMLPLTVPGIVTGAVFIFVLSIGNFLTADLLGGGQVQMIGNLVYDQFLTARDWPFGAALSLLLIAIMMLLLFFQAIGGARGAAKGVTS